MGNNHFLSGADEKVARVFEAQLSFLKRSSNATLQKFFYSDADIEFSLTVFWCVLPYKKLIVSDLLPPRNWYTIAIEIKVVSAFTSPSLPPKPSYVKSHNGMIKSIRVKVQVYDRVIGIKKDRTSNVMAKSMRYFMTSLWYFRDGHYGDALRLFEDIKSSGVRSNSVIHCIILSSYGHVGNLRYGRTIHKLIIGNGLALKSYIQVVLINVYAYCGKVEVVDVCKLWCNGVGRVNMLSGLAKLGMVIACDVRYKSNRVFPEYHPASSSTFFPSLHSNSHMKVLEMSYKDIENSSFESHSVASPKLILNNDNITMVANNDKVIAVLI
ncbi:unnamed protein product [Vicia faba]|uniref:Pentatricopeptide repeat-containing protein n=1 Tax=Vicia faba TaxID=3906 RepID=A0AAV0YE06_VICFA|nr:unnamed protein product [Vicia faba]